MHSLITLTKFICLWTVVLLMPRMTIAEDIFHGFVSGNVDYISHYDQSGAYDW